MSVTFNAAAVEALFAAVTSKAETLGIFDRITQHEPKNAPGNGLSCSVWVDEIAPEPSDSGLGTVSGTVTFSIRVYANMLQEPQDDIDPQVLTAVCGLLSAYAGGFTLGGIIRDVDVLTASAKAGYISQDNRLYRVMVITLPCVINDLWDMAA